MLKLGSFRIFGSADAVGVGQIGFVSHFLVVGVVDWVSRQVGTDLRPAWQARNGRGLGSFRIFGSWGKLGQVEIGFVSRFLWLAGRGGTRNWLRFA